MYCSLPGSSVHGILQARILEWVFIPFWGSSQPRDRIWVSCIAGKFFTIKATTYPEICLSLKIIVQLATFVFFITFKLNVRNENRLYYLLVLL